MDLIDAGGNELDYCGAIRAHILAEIPQPAKRKAAKVKIAMRISAPKFRAAHADIGEP